MNRIPPIDPANATGKSKQLLAAGQSKLGIIASINDQPIQESERKFRWERK